MRQTEHPTAPSGRSPLPGRRRPWRWGDDSLPVQDNPIQSNHLLNNWREASPHTADPNLNVPTTWGRSLGSGNVLKKRSIAWEVRKMLNSSPKAATKLLFIQEMHWRFTKTPFACRADPQAPSVEPNMKRCAGTVLPSLLCQGGDKVCQPSWVPRGRGKVPCPIASPRGNLAQPCTSPWALHPSVLAMARIWAKRLPAGTPVQTDPENIPPTHPSTSNLLGGCLDI